MAKSLLQSSRAPPVWESDSVSTKEAEVASSSPEGLLDGHIDESCASFKELRDHLDGHIEEYHASFKELRDQLDDIHGCLSHFPTNIDSPVLKLHGLIYGFMVIWY